eukprot:7838638-Heterocapsa_arctica.AAC.1
MHVVLQLLDLEEGQYAEERPRRTRQEVHGDPSRSSCPSRCRRARRRTVRNRRLPTGVRSGGSGE